MPSGSFEQQLEAFLAGLRRHESGNRNIPNSSGASSASGYYQYLNGTWNGYGGYRRAMDAPFAVQHARAKADARAAYALYGGDWERVAASHFYPALAGADKSRWSGVPGDERGKRTRGNPPIRQYVNSVLSGTGLGGRTSGRASRSQAPEQQTPEAAQIQALEGKLEELRKVHHTEVTQGRLSPEIAKAREATVELALQSLRLSELRKVHHSEVSQGRLSQAEATARESSLAQAISGLQKASQGVFPGWTVPDSANTTPVVPELQPLVIPEVPEGPPRQDTSAQDLSSLLALLAPKQQRNTSVPVRVDPAAFDTAPFTSQLDALTQQLDLTPSVVRRMPRNRDNRSFGSLLTRIGA